MSRKSRSYEDDRSKGVSLIYIVLFKAKKTELHRKNLILNLNKRIENISSLIEVWCKKKLVFAHALLPFGTVGEATAQTAHLQIAQGDPQPKFAKELFFAFARC